MIFVLKNSNYFPTWQTYVIHSDGQPISEKCYAKSSQWQACECGLDNLAWNNLCVWIWLGSLDHKSAFHVCWCSLIKSVMLKKIWYKTNVYLKILFTCALSPRIGKKRQEYLKHEDSSCFVYCGFKTFDWWVFFGIFSFLNTRMV